MENAADNATHIVSLFAKAAFEVNGKTFDNLRAEDTIASLGMDSVALMELIGLLEEQLALRLPDEELAKVHTLADLGALIQRIQGAPPP